MAKQVVRAETAGQRGIALEARRALWLLGAGALLGLAMAAVGVMRPVSHELPGVAIARVNHRLIRNESFERAAQLVARNMRNPMSEADRARVLQRLIEEELLIQRGEAIGLVESDPAVRKAISASVIQSVVAESQARQPSEDELRAFYQENLRYFAPPETLHVRQLLLKPRDGEAPHELQQRARVARQAIGEGLRFDDARKRYGDLPLLAIPDAPLPAGKLQQYIGPSLVDRVRALQPLEVSQPIESEAGFRIFYLVAATSAETPPFEGIRDRVDSAFRRDAAGRALRDSLGRWWQAAQIVLAPEAPDGVGGDL